MVRPYLIESSTRRWDSLFHEAARHASQLGPGRVRAISHSSDGSTGTVIVWSDATGDGPQQWMRFWFVRSSARTWKSLLDEAARRASQLEPGRLFTITHSSDGGDGVVAVWYWSDHDPAARGKLIGGVSITSDGGGVSVVPEGDDGG